MSAHCTDYVSSASVLVSVARCAAKNFVETRHWVTIRHLTVCMRIARSIGECNSVSACSAHCNLQPGRTVRRGVDDDEVEPTITPSHALQNERLKRQHLSYVGLHAVSIYQCKHTETAGDEMDTAQICDTTASHCSAIRCCQADATVAMKHVRRQRCI